MTRGRPRKIVAEETGKPVEPGGLVKIICITHNVHLGDGRELSKGDEAEVPSDLAGFLIERKQVKRV